MNDVTQPTQKDRGLAALCWFLGPIVALVIGTSQKERSHFVAFHAFQSLALDIASLGIALLSMAIVFVFGAILLVVPLVIIAFLGFAIGPTDQLPPEGQQIVNLVFLVAFGLFFAAPWIYLTGTGVTLLLIAGITWGVSIIVALRVITGHDVRLPVVSRRAEQFIGGNR